MSSRRRVPKAGALINGGLLSPSFKRRRMGAFQMYGQSWCSVLPAVLMPTLPYCSPRKVPVPLCSGSQQRIRQRSQVPARESSNQYKKGRFHLGIRGPGETVPPPFLEVFKTKPGQGSEKLGVREPCSEQESRAAVRCI